MASDRQRIGWIGTGRMGFELVSRLLDCGRDVAVWNRTREKAEPLADQGATIVDTPVDLADRDIVVTMVSSSDVFELVTIGDGGVLSKGDASPKVLVDSSTISAESSERVRREASKVGTELLAAPVSGNPNVVRSGQLTVVVSGDASAYEYAKPPGPRRHGGPTRSRSASSETGPRTSGRSARPSTLLRRGTCRWSSPARTTCTWSTRRFRTSRRCRTPQVTVPLRTGWTPSWWTATTRTRCTARR